MNDIHHKIDHFWLFTDCRWKLFDGRSARSTAPLIGAGKINQELLAAWLLWAEETGYFCIFPDNLPTNMGPPVRGSWINLTSGLRLRRGWRGENNCEYIFGTQFIALFIHFEPFNLLEKWFFSKSSVCSVPSVFTIHFPNSSLPAEMWISCCILSKLVLLNTNPLQYILWGHHQPPQCK